MKMPVLFDRSGNVGKPGSESNRFWCGEGSKCPWVNGERGPRCRLMHPPSEERNEVMISMMMMMMMTIVMVMANVVKKMMKYEDNNDEDDGNCDDDNNDGNYDNNNDCFRSLKKRRPQSWKRKTGVESLKSTLLVLAT